MKFTTENLGSIEDVSIQEIQEILADEGFGGFIILSKDENSYLQAGNEWTPTDECKVFMKQNGSDPWALEYREAGRHMRAKQHMSLSQIQSALTFYLENDSSWKSRFDWDEIS